MKSILHFFFVLMLPDWHFSFCCEFLYFVISKYNHHTYHRHHYDNHHFYNIILTIITFTTIITTITITTITSSGKGRDPAILDHEELFFHCKMWKWLSGRNFLTLFQNICIPYYNQNVSSISFLFKSFNRLILRTLH